MQIYAGPPVFRRRRKPYVQAVLQRYTESGKYQALPTQRIEHPWAQSCYLLACRGLRSTAAKLHRTGAYSTMLVATKTVSCEPAETKACAVAYVLSDGWNGV